MFVLAVFSYQLALHVHHVISKTSLLTCDIHHKHLLPPIDKFIGFRTCWTWVNRIQLISASRTNIPQTRQTQCHPRLVGLDLDWLVHLRLGHRLRRVPRQLVHLLPNPSSSSSLLYNPKRSRQSECVWSIAWT